MPGRHLFQPNEDAVLRRHGSNWQAAQAELPHLQRRQIQKRAQYLGLLRPRPDSFSEADDAAIRRLYPDRTALCAAIPGKGWMAIRKRACRLGIARNRPDLLVRWTPAEDETIRRLYPDYDALREALPGRTRKALVRRASVIGLSTGICRSPVGEASPWTAEEIALLSQPGATIPGRTRSAIKAARVRFSAQPPRRPVARKADETGYAARREARRVAREAGAAKRAAAKAARASAREAFRQAREQADAERRRALEARAAGRQEARAKKVEDRAAARRQREEQRAAAARQAQEAAMAAAREAAALREQARATIVPVPAKGGASLAVSTIAAAARSHHGFELLPAVQVATRSVWPHLRSEVNALVVSAVIAGRASVQDLAPAVRDALATVHARHVQPGQRVA
ncbi:SANT/Myb-like DNA-binding domain-containing protein [Methylobacterium aquaticum]|uniref:SANT/Myb-like DNA-binding domain-containing protein n=1 Tax=Methylobacterium aquaticum TaxID=270351 RepID=UPI003D17F66B